MIQWFEKVLGRENVGAGKIEQEIYGTDASRINGSAKVVVWPLDENHVHQIILYAKRCNLNIVARGAGTSLTGAVSAKDSLVVDFSKMNKILKFGPEYVIVEPGANVDALNRFLAVKGKYFPVIPSSHGVATVGGMISTNASGYKDRMRYGRMKDWIIEAEILDATGKSKILKAEEICGTEGMIGLIIKAKLRITEQIKDKSITIFRFKDIEKLVEKAVELKHNKHILNIELIDSLTAGIAGLENTNYLIAEYDNAEGEILDSREINRVWKKRNDAVARLLGAGYISDEDPVVPIENMVEFLYWLKRKNIPCYGHIGLGIIHANFKTRENINEFYDCVLGLKGEVTGEYGYGLLRKNYMPDDVKRRITALKRQHDPENMMNKDKINFITINEAKQKYGKANEWKGFGTRKAVMK